MDKLREGNTLFVHYPYASYTMDVIIQQRNCPAVSMYEGKMYISGNHHLYGYKTEVSVFPIGMAINCTSSKPDSVSDIEIFRNNPNRHKKFSGRSLQDM